MKRYIYINFFILCFFDPSFSWASEPPCSEFEFFIKAHEVQAYTKDDGTKVSSTNRKEHCREIFLGTKNWMEGFKNNSLEFWPYKEQFKTWTKSEKEIILKIISNWPDVFQSWKEATLYRAVRSQFENNPAASLPKTNAIILYDIFFSYSDRPAVLTHELAHIYVLKLDPDKLAKILRLTGWEKVAGKSKWSAKKQPLKEDSPDSPSEDLANHIEDFLHSSQKLSRERPEVFKALRDLLGSDFNLKEKK